MPGIIVGGGGSAQETTLDKILKGLALANQGVGIASGIQNFRTSMTDKDLKDQELGKRDRLAKGELSIPEWNEAGFDVELAPPPAPGIAEGPRKLPANSFLGKAVTQGGLVDAIVTNRKAAIDQRDYDQRERAIKATEGRQTQERQDRLDAEAKKGTPGQKALDEEYGKEYAKRVSEGGYADAEKGIIQLKDAISQLGKTDAATGPGVGLIPKGARDILLPGGAAIQDAVEEVVQRNLRLVLGAQFTEKEGNRLIARAYNPRLSEAENIKRLTRLGNQMAQALQTQKEADAYFEQNGSLRGFKGKLFKSASDFNLESDGGGSFPRTVRKGNQAVDVSDENELKEAMAEGFR